MENIIAELRETFPDLQTGRVGKEYFFLRGDKLVVTNKDKLLVSGLIVSSKDLKDILEKSCSVRPPIVLEADANSFFPPESLLTVYSRILETAEKHPNLHSVEKIIIRVSKGKVIALPVLKDSFLPLEKLFRIEDLSSPEAYEEGDSTVFFKDRYFSDRIEATLKMISSLAEEFKSLESPVCKKIQALEEFINTILKLNSPRTDLYVSSLYDIFSHRSSLASCNFFSSNRRSTGLIATLVLDNSYPVKMTLKVHCAPLWGGSSDLDLFYAFLKIFPEYLVSDAFFSQEESPTIILDYKPALLERLEQILLLCVMCS